MNAPVKLATALAAHSGPALVRAANGVAYLCHPTAPTTLTKPTPNAHIVMDAGPATRAASNLWPEPGNDFPVMEKIKQMLDPQHLLNKGRLYGRI